MKRPPIRVGKTYYNKGAGTTFRTVIAIGPETPENEAMWFSSKPRPNEPVVTFAQQGRDNQNMFITSFKSWVGGESASQS